MIIVSRFIEKVKDRINKIIGIGAAICPICRNEMKSHGRCTRYIEISGEERRTYSLRIFFCPECHHYHRELPDFMIPYKHYSAETYAEIHNNPSNCFKCSVDEHSFRRMRAWVSAFMKFGEAMAERIKIEYPSLKTNHDAESTESKLKYFVKVVANSNEWKFIGSPVLSG